MTRPAAADRAAAAVERRPRVDPLVPTHQIDRFLGRTHVGTADDTVVAEIETRMAAQTDSRWTPAIRRQTVRYAVWRHHRNLAEYRAVMGGGR